MYKLKSMAIWVDENTKTLYPCETDGSPLKSNGILLSELNQSWFSYLDRSDREYLSNLINIINKKNLWKL
jgi:hypothetical protein